MVILFIWVIAIFGINAQPTPAIPCDPATLTTAVNNAAVDFADGLTDGDETALTFDVLIERIQELKAACVIPADGLHFKSDTKARSLSTGKLADGVYNVTVLNGGVLVVGKNLMHDNSGCTWDAPLPFAFRANNVHTLTATDCDLQVYTTDSIEMVFTPQ